MKLISWTLLCCASMAGAAPVSHVTIWSGGPILTMAGAAVETAEAVAVRNGRILAVGTREQVTKAAGLAARTIDLKGRTLLPGFIDAHGHVTNVGQVASMAQLSAPPVGQVNSIAELQAALRAFPVHPGSPALLGNGYDDSRLAERRHPTRQDLDAVSSTKPILIIHASGHFAAMNSAMLAMVGLTADTSNPPGGVIRREADGKTPNGVLEENALFHALKLLIPDTADAGIAAVVAGQSIYAANGITTAQDGRVMPEAWPALAEAARRNVLIMDTVALLSFDRDWSPEVRTKIGKPYVGRLRIGGVKLTIDGSPQGRTAWLQDPVPVPPEGRDASYRGFPAIDLTVFKAKMAEASANNWQVFAHVNGDQALQTLIDGVAASGSTGKRTIAIHAQVLRPEQLAKMKQFDIQPSFFANHTYYWGDWHREVALGPKRADFISPQASAWATGLRPTAHNDSPVVPPDMLRLVWSSVNRRTQTGDILGPQERIGVYQALAQVTINAAWQLREDATKGSIEAGKLADFAILDRNPVTIDPVRLAEVKVVATVKEGKLIFGSVD